VSNYGVVYAQIDGRGTGFQSDEYLFTMYRSLGTVEIEDQIDVVSQLLADRAYLDPERTGIWGWSYGGYSTTKIIQEDSDEVFKCAIAVAPPTDWLFYDSVYTERYMATPQENRAGYQRASLLAPESIEALRDRNYFLNHGVADDNVHYQQSMFLIKALELANVPFQQQSFPDENHNLNNVNDFLYDSFDRYWSECFGYEIVEK